jgi:hypothetical protein
LFLIAGLAVGVPLFLHLFHRHQARRVSFPALRYLQRTERDHARRIRLRQLLLLLVRSLVVLALVGAGARLFIRGGGVAHPPTAVAIVLDNSMSSGLVLGEERALDRLKALALQTLDAANPEDRIWVVRAGDPWLPALPGDPAAARALVESTTPSAARGDLSASLARAAELVSTSGLQPREIHLLSDLQSTAFDPDRTQPAGDLPVVVWTPPDPVPVNRAITGALVGGGLPPLEGQRSEVTVTTAPGPDDDTVGVSVRVVVDERVRGAGNVPAGSSLSLPLPPTPAGWVLGYAEADADALRVDDRRYFAFHARPAPSLAVAGDPGLFLGQALEVLEAADRLRITPPSTADVVVSVAGEGIAGVGPDGAVLILTPSDPDLLPSLNRRLGEAGIPWQAARANQLGEALVEGAALPESLEGVRVASRYRLVLAADPPAPTRTLGLVAGEAWLVTGSDPNGRRYLLLASPLDAAASTLPVSADMIRFIDWVTGQWAGSGGTPEARIAGEPLPAPFGADRVRLPSGEEAPIDGTRTFRRTREAGFYSFLAGDRVVAVEAVNPPEAESLGLGAEGRFAFERLVGSDPTPVRREDRWERSIYRVRQGPELWWPLLAGALVLLMLESAMAAAGRGRRARDATVGVEEHHAVP